MKKSVVVLVVLAAVASTFAMSKAPEAEKSVSADKACAVKEVCPSCKAAAGGVCSHCKAKADAIKAAAEKASCTNGVCPLKK
ncbi:MAG: hypothetical protein IT583_05030 [Verrucomicrobia bacterium]|nr:hypothetical protein [Verrucomicrobiota bacterium]